MELQVETHYCHPGTNTAVVAIHSDPNQPVETTDYQVDQCLPEVNMTEALRQPESMNLTEKMVAKAVLHHDQVAPQVVLSAVPVVQAETMECLEDRLPPAQDHIILPHHTDPLHHGVHLKEDHLVVPAEPLLERTGAGMDLGQEIDALHHQIHEEDHQ